jgi:hypothetical protein
LHMKPRISPVGIARPARHTAQYGSASFAMTCSFAGAPSPITPGLGCPPQEHQGTRPHCPDACSRQPVQQVFARQHRSEEFG